MRKQNKFIKSMFVQPLYHKENMETRNAFPQRKKFTFYVAAFPWGKTKEWPKFSAIPHKSVGFPQHCTNIFITSSKPCPNYVGFFGLWQNFALGVDLPNTTLLLYPSCSLHQHTLKKISIYNKLYNIREVYFIIIAYI